MKKVLLGIFTLSLAFFGLPHAFGDSANPPKILSVKEISTGPYKPGDVVTIEMEIQGGNPSISRVWASVQNTDLHFNFDSSEWNKGYDPQFAKVISESRNGIFITTLRLSGRISTAAINGDRNFIDVNAKDATDLVASWNSNQATLFPGSMSKITIITDRQIPAGQVRPAVTDDPFNLKFLKSLYSAAQLATLELPRITPNGTPLNWYLTDKGCKITGQRFPGDTGNKVQIDTKITNKCSLDAYGLQPDEGDMKYHIISLSKTIQVNVPIQITCKKGSTTTKVKGLNPTCKSGWKKI